MVLLGSAIEPVAWAFVFTWLYNHTHSTLLCIVLHGGINAAAASLLLPASAVEGSVYLQAALTSNLVVILVAPGVAVLTRGRLGGISATAVVSAPEALLDEGDDLFLCGCRQRVELWRMSESASRRR